MSNNSIKISASSNLVEDLYNAFSFQMTSGYAAGQRPLWYLNLAVDQISFFIGATGSVGVGYMLNQYEPPNIDNLDYINQQGAEKGRWSIFTDLISHTLSHPLHIIQRFFLGGALYVLIGLTTHRMLRKGRPFACGAMTGLYFSYGSSFTAMLKATFGFGVYAIVTEGILYLALRNR